MDQSSVVRSGSIAKGDGGAGGLISTAVNVAVGNSGAAGAAGA
jgi:hypothetical protein